MKKNMEMQVKLQATCRKPMYTNLDSIKSNTSVRCPMSKNFYKLIRDYTDYQYMTLNSMTRSFRRGTHSQQSWMPNRHYKCHMSKTQLEFLSHLIFPQTFPPQSMTTRIFHLLRPPTLFIIIPDSRFSHRPP